MKILTVSLKSQLCLCCIHATPADLDQHENFQAGFTHSEPFCNTSRNGNIYKCFTFEYFVNNWHIKALQWTITNSIVYLNCSQHPAIWEKSTEVWKATMVHRGLCVAQYQRKQLVVKLFLLFLIQNNRSQILKPQTHLTKPRWSLLPKQCYSSHPWRALPIPYLTIWYMVPLTSLDPLCQYLSYD